MTDRPVCAGSAGRREGEGGDREGEGEAEETPKVGEEGRAQHRGEVFTTRTGRELEPTGETEEKIGGCCHFI